MIKIDEHKGDAKSPNIIDAALAFPIFFERSCSKNEHFKDSL